MRSPVDIALFSAAEILLVLGLLWLFTSGIPALVVMIKRFFFARRLEKFCRKKGYALTWVRPWHRSVFRQGMGYDFVMTARGKNYHVTQISARHRHREHLFQSPTEMVIRRVFRLRGVRGGRVVSRMYSIDLGVSEQSRPIDLTCPVPEGDEKLLLFYPVSRDVTCLHQGGKTPVGNGDPILEGYRFLNRSAFFEEFSGEGRYLKKRNPWDMI
ncbi:MAG: hypothetical protein IKJ74_02180 [Clostridia bacterium]|nr:hypothetical protein [Clostridia bacterium]